MLKPLAKKKAMALPPPHAYLEEWQAHASAAGHVVGIGGSGGHSFSLSLNALHPPAAALRIQLRYRKYQQKVRALLTRSDKGSGDAPPPGDDALTSATGSVKAALRERGVAGSSMALAIAYSARKESVHDSESASQRTLPLVRQSTNSSLQRSYTAEMRASRKEEPPTKWTTTEWTAPATATIGTLHDVHESDARANDTSVGSDSDASGADVVAVATTAAAPKHELHEAVDAEALDATPTSAREHGFVDIMHHSWLLASMEERCADTAASIGATSRTGTRALQVADFRHTVLDLVFIARSGVGHNLHGRAPSAVAVHHRNLLARVRHALDHSSEAAVLSAADEQRVNRIFRGLQSDMIMPAVRTLGWLLTKTWRLLFHGVHVDVASLHRVLASVADAQRESDVSVVFAPTHKSHLDYLIISYLCFAYGIPLPRIAAGNNLDLPLLGPFLRANGSFFIRRSFRDDVLYKHVLQSYVHELMSDGNPIEVFVEGGRSRHGRVCKPRLGFLSMFHEYTKLPVHPTTSNSSSGRKKSVLLVPISLDYDKVYEVEGYAAQLLGKPKEKESIGGFLKSVWDIFFLRCGHSYVRFGAPLALTAESALDGTARELAVRMQTCGTVTSTSIVSALLMWKRRYQTREMLQTRVHWLVAELSQRAVHITHVTDDAIADHALSILNVVVHANGVLAPQLEVPARALEVGFYRNHLLHVFLPDMAVAGAIDALLRDTVATECGRTSVCIGLVALEEKTLMVWNFLRHICRHDTTDIVARISAFVRAQSPACRVEDDVVVVDLACWKASKLVGFALSLLWPFVDSLWLCSQGLWSLLSTDAVVDTSGSSTASQAFTEHTERAVVQRVQTLARELFQQRTLAHAEAFCSESVKQSLDFLVERGLIEYVDTRDDRSRVIAFCNADAREAPGIVQALVDEVNGWRRPESRLWRPRAVAPANLSREVALALMLRSTGSLSVSPGV